MKNNELLVYSDAPLCLIICLFLSSNFSCVKIFGIFRANLNLVTELGDRAAQGRALGNLGNTHYLLGNFLDAIRYHEQVIAVL